MANCVVPSDQDLFYSQGTGFSETALRSLCHLLDVLLKALGRSDCTELLFASMRTGASSSSVALKMLP